ncbi:COPII subunit SFB2 [Saccharomyces paradoxus]|uniref:COPII subunit SFB2 n=1 Tax=Saccharomyces paradoxus TaxID=27291 RepID=A0A8B8UYU4_SACPA|nr:Sfb2 [Saccharomyces paradoxus]QHS75856.1 Sfb2 [Saccharomyces paradoxus]
MSHHKKRVYPQAQVSYTASVPIVAEQQQSQQQIDQTAYAMGDLQLNNNSYSLTQLAQNQQFPGTGKVVNQLYPVDLFTELPPPIRDLSLPPPPITISQDNIVTPSESSNIPYQYVRSTLNAVPKTSSLLKKTKLPFAIVIRPYLHLQDSENQVPLNTDGVIVRCRRCRSYMNPFVVFINQGRKWQCNICRFKNDVPFGFDQNLQGAPINRYERNEIKNSIIDYLAPVEYSVREPPPSVYVFILDVSQNAVKNGLLATSARTILENIEFLPNHDGRTRISIICVDHNLHYFYVPLDDDYEESDNDSEELDEADEDEEEEEEDEEDDTSETIQMFDIGDLDEPFLPMPSDELVVPLKYSKKNLEKLLKKIPEIFQDTHSSKFALGPALKAASNLIKSTGGKVEVISSTLPNTGVGKLKKRSEQGVLNTPKESSQLLSCKDSFYKTFTIECSKLQITVDMFLASEDYMDVASLSHLGRFSGGQTHFYPGFNATSLNDVTKFTRELSRHLTMDISMEAVMRVRGSTGLRATSFFGHFFNRSSDLCAFSTMPRDQSYLFGISIEDSLMAEYCYLQVSTLLTLNTGERRIRVMTLALPTTESAREVFASADQLAIADFITQNAVTKALNSSMYSARDFITKSLEDILSAYKKEISMSNINSVASLNLCANLRMLPLLMNALSKHIALRPGVVPSDYRASALNKLETEPLHYLIKSIYPTVYSLHDMPDEVGLPDFEGKTVLPEPINATISLFERYGLYLIDNSAELFLWVGGDAVPELLIDVFNTDTISNIPVGKSELPPLNNSPFNERLRNIISNIRENNDTITFQSLYIIRGPSINEPANLNSERDMASLRLWALSTLVEDKVLNCASYREYLQSMKTAINR